MNNLLKIYLTVLLIFPCASGCIDDNSASGNGGNQDTFDWLIPANEVFDGGPGKDGIPALTDPELISEASATYLNEEDLVLGYVNGEDARAYPHRILDWHEIINDDLDTVSVAVIYCPLTGTGIGWDRNFEVGKTTFGVS